MFFRKLKEKLDKQKSETNVFIKYHRELLEDTKKLNKELLESNKKVMELNNKIREENKIIRGSVVVC